MTKKQKGWMIFGITAGAVYATFGVVGIIFAIVSIFYDPFLSPKMVKYYSNDDNFAHYKGVISECSLNEKNDYIGLLLKDVESLEEDVENPRYNPNYGITTTVFANDIVSVWEDFSPYQDLEFDFYGTFHQFYSSCPKPIIQISVNGKEVLNYNDGKEALIKWAKTVH